MYVFVELLNRGVLTRALLFAFNVHAKITHTIMNKTLMFIIGGKNMLAILLALCLLFGGIYVMVLGYQWAVVGLGVLVTIIGSIFRRK